MMLRRMAMYDIVCGTLSCTVLPALDMANKKVKTLFGFFNLKYLHRCLTPTGNFPALLR